MKTLKIFGWLSHFLMITIFLIGILFFLATKSSFRFDDYSKWTLLINNIQETNHKGTYIKMFFILIWILYILYFIAIFIFNLSVRDFEKRIFISLKHSNRFRLVGIIFIFNYIISLILNQYIIIRTPDDPTQTSHLFSEKILTNFQTPLGGLIIGFFFLVLSQVFKEALKQKQENELTI